MRLCVCSRECSRKALALPSALLQYALLFDPPAPLSRPLKTAVETLLERWVVHYRPQLPDSPSHLSRSALSRLNPAAVYKRLVITLRSLYSYARLLPAYRLYCACKVRGRVCLEAGRGGNPAD